MQRGNSSNHDQWHVSDGGQMVGAYRFEQLGPLLATRQVSEHAVVWDGQGWVKLRAMLESAGYRNEGQNSGVTLPPAPSLQAPKTDELMDVILLEDDAGTPGTFSAADLEERFPEAVSAEPQAPPAPVAPALDGPPPERDRIVVIGRRAAGKTIYLARLYERLWRSTGELSLKAITGPVHLFLEQVAECLRRGDWPPATISSTHIELEVLYRGRRQVMVGLDYAGELFSRAFVHEETDSPEVRELLGHIDRAAAVIVLVDPAVIVGKELSAMVDDDFGIVKAVERIRRWPGGDEVPVVLVLTKYDQRKALLQQHGGPKKYVLAHFPALARTLQRVRFFAMSAVQAARDEQGRLRPRPDSVAVGVEEPLVYCLNQIEKSVLQAEADVRRRMEEERLRAMTRAMEEQERRRQNRFAVFMGCLILAGACIILLIYFLRS